MTASAWVKQRTDESPYGISQHIQFPWSWLEDMQMEDGLLSVAVRESKKKRVDFNVHPVSEEIFSMESLTVDGHNEKKENMYPAICTFNPNISPLRQIQKRLFP